MDKELEAILSKMISDNASEEDMFAAIKEYESKGAPKNKLTDGFQTTPDLDEEKADADKDVDLDVFGAKKPKDRFLNFLESAGRYTGLSKKWLKQSGVSGLGRANAFDETRAIFFSGGEVSDEEAQNYYEAALKEQSVAELTLFENWSKNYDKQVERGRNPLMATMIATKEEGTGGLLQVMLQSFAGLANPEILAAGAAPAAAGATFGPLTAIGGFFGGANAAAESIVAFSQSIQELISDQGLDFTPENIKKVLSDEETFKKIRNRSLARGVTIGTIEGFTSALGVKAAGTVATKITGAAGKGVLGRGLAYGAGFGTAGVFEFVGGAGGETLGLTIEGKPLDPKEIIVEGIAGVGAAPVTATIGFSKAILNKPSYKIKGESVNAAYIDDIIKTSTDVELAAMDIEIKNDDNRAKLVYEKQANAVIGSQIDARVTGEDRNTLIALQKEKSKAESDVKKKGIFKVINAEAKLKDINTQIENILNKYEGADVDVEIEERSKKITEAVAEKIFQKGITFAKKHSALYGLEVDDTLTVKQIEEVYGKEAAKADGFIQGGKIIINTAVARDKKAVNVGSHELLHGILRKAIREGKINADLIEEFRAKLTAQDNALIDQRIKEGEYDTMTVKADEEIAKRLNVKKGTEVSYLDAFQDEYLTIFSDLVRDNQITFEDKTILQQIGDLFTPLFRAFGFKKINFDTADSVYEFLREYNKSIHKGALSSDIVKATKGDFKVEGRRLSKTLLEEINDLIPDNVKTKAQYDDFINDPIKSRKTLNSIYEPSGVINNYIRSRQLTKAEGDIMIEKVVDRVLKFNPQAKREDGSTVGIEAFGERIFADTRYAKLTAKEVLAKKGKTKKIIIEGDAPTGTGQTVLEKAAGTVADVTTETKIDTKEKTSRKIKRLSDVNINNKKIIKQHVYDKIFDLIQQNPPDLTQKIKLLIENDFAKVVKNQMGKISKIKGEVVVSEEYKAFHALEFDNIVKALPMRVIKENYSNLFKKTKIGKEDKKTKKSDKPSLKKDSNYRVGIYRIDPVKKSVFGKHFLIGGYTTLLARQKKLAEHISESIALEQLQKFKIENSTDVNAVLEAKIDDAVNVLDKQKNENALFDVIKLSKRAKADLSVIMDLVKKEGYSNVFNDNGTINNKYKNKVPSLILVSAIRPIKPIKLNESIKAIEDNKKTTPQAVFAKSKKAGAAAINKKIQDLGFKPLDKNNVNDRKSFENFLRKEFTTYLPVEVINAETFGNRTSEDGRKKSGLYFTSGQRNSIVAEAKKNKKAKKFTKEAKDKIKEAMKSTRNNYKQNFNSKAYQQKINKNWQGVELILQAFAQMVKDNPDNIRYVGAILGTSAGTTGHFVRQIAMPIGKEDGLVIQEKGNISKKDGISEHTLQANFAANFMFDAVARDEVELMLPFLEKNYYQLGISLATDNKFKDIDGRSGQKYNYSVTPPPSFVQKLQEAINKKDYENAPNILLRLVHENVNNNDGGININEIKIKGKSIAEIYGLGVDEKSAALSEVVSKQLELLNNLLKGEITQQQATKGIKSFSAIPFSKTNKKSEIISKATAFSRSSKNKQKGISVLDFDDTLATTKSLVKYKTPDGKEGTLNAEEYARDYVSLLEQGYEFDFSDFSKVVKGKVAPLFNKALKLQKKFGPDNMFVLTARPADSAKAIFDFLKANGLNIPLKNITGLANSTSEAKALWIAEKVGEGYNDFYFADDALQNVQAVKNMLEQFDVKSKVQQAKIKFSKSMNKDFNVILEQVKGVSRDAVFSAAKAKKRGAKKGKYAVVVPPSADDFVGLLYYFMGKGRQGEKHFNFFKRSLLDPMNKGYRDLNAAKQSIANDFALLKKHFPEVRRMLNKIILNSDYTYSDAVRVYLWDKAGFEIPGLSKKDKKFLIDTIKNDPEMQSFADALGLVSKRPEGYVKPGENWFAGDIRTDLDDATNKIGRKEFLKEFIENLDEIFSTENLNKIEALYGTPYREALEDMIYRMKNGTNRSFGNNRIVNNFMDWINGSIGTTMFFNARSAILQTISTVNFINWGDNNVFKAAAAFANQKQFWADFAMLFNSDMLKQRRAGLKTDINAAELASHVRKSNQPVRAAISWLLSKGFLPTQIADSFAIASGGASMYRNRVNTYKKQGLSQKKAEQKAFLDFAEIAEETQQSARPDRISQQQASVLGRLILAFQNTPMQYVRLMKKAYLDLINNRGDVKTNVSKIIYYGLVQNLVFYGLQQALFAMLFGDDDDKDSKFFKQKKQRVANGMMDTILRGMGVTGAVISTVKNVIITFAEQKKVPKWKQDEYAELIEALQISPPIGIKARKLVKAKRTYKWDEDVMKQMQTLDIDNPIWSAVGNVVEATTNVPLNRLHKKALNIREALNEENEAWQRIAVGLGWSTWDVGIDKKELEEVKEQTKKVRTRSVDLYNRKGIPKNADPYYKKTEEKEKKKKKKKTKKEKVDKDFVFY